MASFPTLAFIVISLFLVFGCTNIASQINNNTSLPSSNPIQLQANCLGLTAEKVQQVCGSGPLKRIIEKISNQYQIKEGYRCTYHVLDTAIPGCENSTSKDTICPVELTLTYDRGKNLSDIASEFKRMRQTCNGFYSLRSEDIGFERQLILGDFYRQNGSTITTLYSSDLDYEAMGENPAQACSFCEIWQLQSYLYNETSEEAPEECRLREAIDNRMLIENITVPATNSSPCFGIIFEIKINESGSSNESERGADIRNGNDTTWHHAEKNQKLFLGGEIQTGLDTEVMIVYQCGKNVLGASLVRPDTLLRITELSEDGVRVFIDPAVTTSAVKQLPQFQADFQVAPPNEASCGVRG